MGEKAPHVELLWWEGCPSWPRALEELRAVLEDAGLDPEAIDVREIKTEEDAAEEDFAGSPTIKFDGDDIQPPGEEMHARLTCRIYKLRDGRVSPTPDPADVRDALEQAIARVNKLTGTENRHERSAT
jgi:hypothetical protein